ncbi:CS1 type fimbrial major subunit [Pseudomonas weihenstephanensis]|uniref:Adhesin n=1 Tax=Pseudomonas weihenstephanensis TaxID=1608994 RepID=A0ABS1ZMD3_9PSED|nr:CS1 type fimbrial major subunit [Pseudomonas weihenstephanensis]MBM1197108.1 adhesin [Pseudomonas weihenstephanensis]
MRAWRSKPSQLSAMLALLAWASQAPAAREEHTFEVSVSIPTYALFVIPVDPGFLEQEQQMHWNLVNETLQPLRAEFDVASAAGAVTSRLGYEPVLFNGRDTIALNVTFNQQPLTLQDTVIVRADQAWPGKRVPLRIDALKPEEGFRAGEYYGSVQITFDAAAP